jgi:hypothetical protein
MKFLVQRFAASCVALAAAPPAALAQAYAPVIKAAGQFAD